MFVFGKARLVGCHVEACVTLGSGLWEGALARDTKSPQRTLRRGLKPPPTARFTSVARNQRDRPLDLERYGRKEERQGEGDPDYKL